MADEWRLYGGQDGVSAAFGDKGRLIDLGPADVALALAETIRREYIPDTSGAPGSVRIRQSWHISPDPHAVVVLHVQVPHMTAYELGGLRDVVERIEVLADRIERRLNLDAGADG